MIEQVHSNKKRISIRYVNKKIQSAATMKLRETVRKHFLSQGLEEVEQMSVGYKLKLIHAFNLFQFKRAMLSVFPPES